jgi:hypothetical protein
MESDGATNDRASLQATQLCMEVPMEDRTTKEKGILAQARNNNNKSSNKTTSLVGPCHMLMAQPLLKTSGADSRTNGFSSEKIVRFDPRIQRDYIFKRKRIYEYVEWDAAGGKKRKFVENATTTVSVWDGVSKVERHLVECCERCWTQQSQNKNEYGEIDDDLDDAEYVRRQVASLSSSSSYLGGVLAIEKEAHFAAILASKCNTMSSRSLAIAILERTLVAYLRENHALLKEKQAKEETLDQEKDVGDDDDDEEEEEDETEVPNTRSSRYTRVHNPRIRLKVEDTMRADASSMSSQASESSDAPSQDTRTSQRFEHFFAAGGLKILSQWLGDASAYDIVTYRQQPTVKYTKKNPPAAMTTTERRASATRPIVVTILHFLEHIPIEKKMVMGSKINKQIQNLGKRIAKIIEAQQNGNAPEEDLNNWTSTETVSNVEALQQALEAVSAVKAAWRKKTAQKQPSITSFNDPFQSFKDSIKERMEELNQFQRGVIAKPEWYQFPGTEKAAISVKKKKTSMKELAAKERQAERQKLQMKIQQVKSKNSKSLAELRKRLQKIYEEKNSPVPAPQKSNGKSVAWKDGMKTEKLRNRHKLEEVFVFVKDLPASNTEVAFEDTNLEFLTDSCALKSEEGSFREGNRDNDSEMRK